MKPSPKPATPLDWAGNPYNPETHTFRGNTKKEQADVEARARAAYAREVLARKLKGKSKSVDTESSVPPSEDSAG